MRQPQAGPWMIYMQVKLVPICAMEEEIARMGIVIVMKDILVISAFYAPNFEIEYCFSFICLSIYPFVHHIFGRSYKRMYAR